MTVQTSLGKMTTRVDTKENNSFMKNRWSQNEDLMQQIEVLVRQADKQIKISGSVQNPIDVTFCKERCSDRDESSVKKTKSAQNLRLS